MLCAAHLAAAALATLLAAACAATLAARPLVVVAVVAARPAQRRKQQSVLELFERVARWPCHGERPLDERVALGPLGPSARRVRLLALPLCAVATRRAHEAARGRGASGDVAPPPSRARTSPGACSTHPARQTMRRGAQEPAAPARRVVVRWWLCV